MRGLLDAVGRYVGKVFWFMRGMPRRKADHNCRMSPSRLCSLDLAVLRTFKLLGGYASEAQGAPEITMHGFRSTFGDWASELISFPMKSVNMRLPTVSAAKLKLPTDVATNSENAASSWTHGRRLASQMQVLR
jgi:hypothetical protein